MSEEMNVTEPKFVPPVVKPVPIVPTFCVYKGSQPVFTSEDESLCHAVANREKAISVAGGVDVRDSEHRIRVQAL